MMNARSKQMKSTHILYGRFGISTSLQQIGAMCCTNKGPDYLKYFDWRGGMWTLVLPLGALR